MRSFYISAPLLACLSYSVVQAQGEVAKIEIIVAQGLQLAQKNDQKGLGELIKNSIDYDFLVPKLVEKSFRGISPEDKTKLVKELRKMFPEKIAQIYSTDGKMKIFKEYTTATSEMGHKEGRGVWVKTMFTSKVGPTALVEWLVSPGDSLKISKIKFEKIDMEPSLIEEFKQRFKKAKNNVDVFLKDYAATPA